MKRGSHLENKAIFAENLTKFYGKARGIDGLNLEVAPGEFFGFIGPNGAGKSTTIRTLLGLISPTAGKGRVFGMDIVKNKKISLASFETREIFAYSLSRRTWPAGSLPPRRSR